MSLLRSGRHRADNFTQSGCKLGARQTIHSRPLQHHFLQCLRSRIRRDGEHVVALLLVRQPAQHVAAEPGDPVRRAAVGRRLHGGGDRIHVAHLLQHTAGLRDRPVTPDLVGLSPPALASALVGDGPVTPPGEHFTYANDGYVLIGLVLDAVTGDATAEITRTTLGGTDGGFTA